MAGQNETQVNRDDYDEKVYTFLDNVCRETKLEEIQLTRDIVLPFTKQYLERGYITCHHVIQIIQHIENINNKVVEDLERKLREAIYKRDSITRVNTTLKTLNQKKYLGYIGQTYWGEMEEIGNKDFITIIGHYIDHTYFTSDYYNREKWINIKEDTDDFDDCEVIYNC